MKYTLYAGSYAGIPVRIHFTFPLILIVFGVEAWIGGGWLDALQSVGLILAVFVCVVLHEFGHSLQAKRYGINVRDIVLLPIGGMARAERIPEKPRQEIVMAISGPLVNFALAAIVLGIILVRRQPMDLGTDFLASLFGINLVLGAFNLIPAYPMDGGRILRGLLATKLPYLRATRYAKNVGQIIALFFVVVGFVDNTFIMLPVIAVFIYFGAISEERAIRIRVTLEGRRVRDFVGEAPMLLSPTDTVESAPVPATGFAAVLDDQRRFLGIVAGRDVAAAMAAGKGAHPLSSITNFNVQMADADIPAMRAYYLMAAEKIDVVGVVDRGAFAGLLRFDNLLKK